MQGYYPPYKEPAGNTDPLKKIFTKVKVKLLNDYHPAGYEEEWLDKDDEVTAEFVPNGKIYLTGPYGTFHTDAIEGAHFYR
jgi:hypothetical protein